MARVEGIKKSLIKRGVEEQTVRELTRGGHLVDVIERMEAALDAEVLREILDEHGCGGGKEYLARLKKIGKDIAALPLADRVAHVDAVTPASERYALNDDGTLAVTLAYDGGLPDDGGGRRYRCLCSAAVSKGVRVADLAAEASGRVMPLAYCHCCAGSCRRHLELQLGVALRTKAVVSAPIHSQGGAPCGFVFEVV